MTERDDVERHDGGVPVAGEAPAGEWIGEAEGSAAGQAQPRSEGDRRRRGALLASLLAAAVLLAAGLITGVMLMNANQGSDGDHRADGNHEAGGGSLADDTGEARASGGSGTAGGTASAEAGSGRSAADGPRTDASQVLPRAMSGQEAIDALGDDIGVVAERNGMSVEELERTLLANPSAKVSKTGFLMLP